MASAISFSLVLIQVELMQRGESTSSIQKNRPKAQPASDDLQAWLHQQMLLVLSASFNKIGWGSSVGLSKARAVSEAQ